MTDDKTYEGTVIFFAAGSLNFGFIGWEKDGFAQPDLFLHYSDIVMKDGGFKTVKKGAKVSFKLGTNVRNQPKAIEVSEFEAPITS